MMMKEREKRTSKRYQVSAHVEVRLDRGVLLEGCVVDISESGLLLTTERSLPLDIRVKVHVFPGEGGCLDENRFCCHGTVARLDLRGVAIAFDELDDATRTHLEDLVVRHAGNLNVAAHCSPNV